MFFLHGGGQNGKSTFVNTLRRIMGDFAKIAPIDTFTASTSEGIRPNSPCCKVRGWSSPPKPNRPQLGRNARSSS